MTALAGDPRMTLRDRLGARWDGLARAERVLLVLFGATVVMKVIAYVGVAGGILIGDEGYYLDSGRALSNAVRAASSRRPVRRRARSRCRTGRAGSSRSRPP